MTEFAELGSFDSQSFSGLVCSWQDLINTEEETGQTLTALQWWKVPTN